MIRPMSIVLLGVFTAGCATSEQNAAIECGAGGAIATSLLCKLAGGDTTKCLIAGGAVGTVAGVGCYAWSKKLDRDREALKGHEDDLDANLKYVGEVNTTMAQNNADTRKKIDELSSHSNATAMQVSTASLDQKQLTDRGKQIDKLIKENNDALTYEKEALADARNFQARHPSEDMTAQIRTLESNLAETGNQAKALASLKGNA